MSNRNRTMKKKNRLTGRNFGFLTAIALSAVLVGGQFTTEIVTAYSTEMTESKRSVFPDNITVDKPTALVNVLLPANNYGTLAWADGSYVPQKRVQSCEVILTPAEGVDLSAEEGWDEETGTVSGYVHVVITSITDDKTEVLPEENEETSNEEIGMEDTENKEQQDEETLSDPAEEESENVAPNEDDLGDEMPDETTGKDDTSKDDTTTDNTVDDKHLAETEPADEETMPDSENADHNDVDNNMDNDNSDQDDNTDNKDDEDDKEEIVVGDPGNADEEDPNNNIFDNPISPDEKDERPSDADEDLSDEEKEARAQMNHTCDGITVSGVNLPWYVQFRVSSGDSYQFTNESDAMIFQSYEFELWDLKNNTEYEIPSGEYISVTVPVKAGYEYTIEHLLDNGAMETIIPSVDGDTMVFSTHSFSPFGIAGSKQLVGPETGNDTGSGDATVAEPSTDTDVQVTPGAVSMDQTVDKIKDIQDPAMSEETDTDRAAAVKTNDTNVDQESDIATPDTSASKTEGAVNTGDTTTILPFVIVLVVAAVVIIGAVAFMKKRKK